jgi:hypothetical protein
LVKSGNQTPKGALTHCCPPLFRTSPRLSWDGDKLRPIRRIGYRDPDTGKLYAIIGNQFSWSAKAIADICKQRCIRKNSILAFAHG